MSHSPCLSKGALAGALLGLFSASTAGGSPVPWISHSQRNCYNNTDDGFKGAYNLSFETNPVVSPKLWFTLGECIDLCKNQTGCDGVMMQDVGEDQPNCWLRKGINQDNCSKAYADFTLYQNPLVYEPEPGFWSSYPALDCTMPEASVQVSLKPEDVSGVSIRMCETLCKANSECTAITWKQIGAKDLRGLTRNCWLYKTVELDKCVAGAASKYHETRTISMERVPSTTRATSTHSTSSSSTSRTTSSSTTVSTSTVGSSTTPGVTPSSAITTSVTPLASGSWPTLASVNCYRGFGGDSVSSDLDPWPGHHVLGDCQAKCKSILECEAVVMRDTHDGTSNNCYLRKNLVLTACETSAPLYNIWIKPNLPSGARLSWHSYASKNCHPGAGADYAIPGQDNLPGHLDMVRCEEECNKVPGCEAIVWHDTCDGTRPNCFLRKNVVVPNCIENPSFNLRIKASVLTTARTTAGPAPPTTTPTTPTPPTTPTTPTTPTPPAPTAPASIFTTAWPTVAATNCYNGHGGENLAEEGYDPVPVHQLLTHCQAMCLAKEECQAIILADVQSGQAPNCWLRKNINLALCLGNPASNVWFKPGVRQPSQDRWLSFSATNCYPGMGAEYAIPGQDVLPTHMQLTECEQKCISIVGCQAIVWHDTKDPNSPNCYLRKNVQVSQCHQNQAFNLRMLNPQYIPPAPTPAPPLPPAPTPPLPPAPTPVPLAGPWPTIAGKFCEAGTSGTPIAAPGFNPYPVHQLLMHCQMLCQQQADCSYAVMRDVTSGHTPNCWLLKSIELGMCKVDENAAVWLKPGVPPPFTVEWVSYAGTNCYEGRGGSYAVPGQDVVPGHDSLKECEKICNEIDACQAFIWHDTKDSVTSNCYLRKNIIVESCEKTQAFNLRLKAKFDVKRFSVPEDVQERLAHLGKTSTWSFSLPGCVAAGLLSLAAIVTLAKRWTRPSTRVMLTAEANELSDPEILLVDAE